MLVRQSFLGSDRTYGARRVWHDVLDCQFQADAPNQKWVAGFSCIWTAEGRLYAVAVLDLYSRHMFAGRCTTA
jgi:putative transposase